MTPEGSVAGPMIPCCRELAREEDSQCLPYSWRTLAWHKNHVKTFGGTMWFFFGAAVLTVCKENTEEKTPDAFFCFARGRRSSLSYDHAMPHGVAGQARPPAVFHPVVYEQEG